MNDTLYDICCSLEWKLGCHLTEWNASQKLPCRTGEAGQEQKQTHCDDVLKLLREHVTVLEQRSNALEVAAEPP